MMTRIATILGIAAIAFSFTLSRGADAEVKFTPLAMNQGNSENRTGMWFCPDLGKAGDILPLKTRVWATKESVTDGVAMKCVFDKGSTGIVAYEIEKLPAETAGLTFYAKASRKAKLNVGKIPVEVDTEWKKIDVPWEKLGTTKDNPKIGFQLMLTLAGPIEEKTWIILDRIGTEGPTFDPKPKIDPKTGPDATISSRDILYGAEHLAKTAERAKAKQPFKVITLGDSLTAGAQCYRGTWNVKGADGVPFLYFSHAARLWEGHFGTKGITPVQHGHGGWTSAQALKVVDKEVVEEAGANDLVILQFGGNDLTWAKVSLADWKANMKKLIARAKTKTDQILLVSNVPGGDLAGRHEEVTKIYKELVEEEKVAVADLLKFASYRGEPFAYAWLANEGHPAYMGHITCAEMIAPILTGQHRTYPE